MGEFETLIWIAYGVTGLVMFWLLWRTVKDLHNAEMAMDKMKEVSSAALATASYKVNPTEKLSSDQA